MGDRATSSVNATCTCAWRLPRRAGRNKGADEATRVSIRYRHLAKPQARHGNGKFLALAMALGADTANFGAFLRSEWIRGCGHELAASRPRPHAQAAPSRGPVYSLHLSRWPCH